jgi:putative oxidoreductase
MSPAVTVGRINQCAAVVVRPVQALFLAALRIYVSWQFLKSGWLKLQDWETTRFLFEEEYKVPLLSPALAAILGTAGEILFPVLLIVGLLSRYAALGLSVVNVIAVVSYAHVLMSEGFEAALGQHYLWGLMLLTVLLFGPGRYSLDGMAAASAPARAGSA